VHLRDALAAVLRSDQAQGFRKDDSPSSRANIGETRELRAAVRALIQHIEEQDRTHRASAGEREADRMTEPNAVERVAALIYERDASVRTMEAARAEAEDYVAATGLVDEVDRLRAGIQWARGLCSDEEPYAAIDAYLGGLLR
jgi:hypothetical protein